MAGGPPVQTGAQPAQSSTWPLEFAFRVTRPSSGVDLRPLTARARVVRKPRFPGAGAKATKLLFDLRPGDGEENSSGGRCRLICQTRRSPGVIVRRSGGGFAVKVGPLPIRDPPQATGGRRISRLRVAGRCDGFVGLSSALIRCSKPKLSRKLG